MICIWISPKSNYPQNFTARCSRCSAGGAWQRPPPAAAPEPVSAADTALHTAGCSHIQHGHKKSCFLWFAPDCSWVKLLLPLIFTMFCSFKTSVSSVPRCKYTEPSLCHHGHIKIFSSSMLTSCLSQAGADADFGSGRVRVLEKIIGLGRVWVQVRVLELLIGYFPI